MQSAYNQANTGTVLAQASYNTANNKLDLSGGVVYGNVTVNNLTANTAVISPELRSTGGTTHVYTSDIGIVAIDVGGGQTKFFNSGVEVSGDVYAGTYGGNRVSLGGGEAKLQSLRTATVQIQTGTDGTVSNTWTFNGNKLTFPDNSVQNTAFTGVGLDQFARDVANSASANTIVTQGVDVWQNNSIIALQSSLITINSNSAYSSAIDNSQNSRMTIIEGTDLSQNVSIAAQNSFITIIQGTDTSQNARMTIIENTDVSQNVRLDWSNTSIAATDGKMQSAYNQANTANAKAQAAFDTANTAGAGVAIDAYARQTANSASSNTIIIQGTDASQNVRLDYSNTAITIIQGTDVGQNSRITITEGTDVSQNVRLDYSNTAITIIQGTDTSQNARMTIIEGTDVGQNTRMTIADGVDVSQNTRIDYSNTAITIIQGVDLGQNTAIAATDGKMQSAYNQANTGTVLAQASYAQANVTVGVDVSQNVRIDYSNTVITIIQGTDVGQNSRMSIIEGTNASQNVRIDYSNTAITIIRGVDTSQNVRIDYSNTAIGIIQGTDISQNTRIDYSNTAITIIQGTDVGQNSRMTIIEGTNASQNVRIDYSNTVITIIQGTDVGQNSRMTIIEGTDVGQNSRMTIIENTDLSQNTRIDYSNTAITILQGVNAGQNANIAFVQTLANTDFTNVSITATTSSSNGLYIPVITVAANGRVTAISNTLITSSGGGGSSINVVNEITNSNTFYLIFSNTSSGLLGTTATANTSNTKLYYQPSTGTLNATTFNSLSDENRKTNIKIISNALEITENLNGVTFDWTENGLSSAGLIAQDVEKYLPQLVANSVENGKSLNYDGVIGVLVEAIKELSQRVKDLEGR
jgi:flagellar biogenesis protein FliO